MQTEVALPDIAVVAVVVRVVVPLVDADANVVVVVIDVDDVDVDVVVLRVTFVAVLVFDAVDIESNVELPVKADDAVVIVVATVLCRITRYTMRLPPSVCGASQNSLWTEQ